MAASTPRFASVFAVALVAAFSSGCSDSSPGVRPEGLTEVAWGEQLFYAKGCAACHDLRGGRRDGPPLTGRWAQTVELVGDRTDRFDETYVRRSILEPAADVLRGYPPTMPSYQGSLSAAELDALVAFVRDHAAP